jgi:uncharacterized protein (TIRG00374 family)
MRRAARWLVWPVVLGVLLWAAWTVDWADVAGRLAAIRAWQWLLLVIFNAAIVLAFSGRWWAVLRGMNLRPGYFRLAAYRLAGFSVSYFTPGSQFGGEPLQIALLRRKHGIALPASTASVTLDKALEVLGNATFLAFGLAVLLRLRWLDSRQAVLPALVAGLLLLVPLCLLLAWWTGRRPLTRLGVWVARQPQARWPALTRLQEGVQVFETQAGAFCRQRPWHLTLAMGFSLISWFGIVIEFWMMLRFLGAALGPTDTIAVVTASRLALLVPIPAALGALEASQIFALQAVGYPATLGISLSLLIRLRDLLFGGLGLALAARWTREGLDS